MKSWNTALHDSLISGSIASILSTLVLAWRGKQERDNSVNPTNATSQWVWGESATRRNKASLRHTAVGYIIHHAASIFWAVFYEKWLRSSADKNSVASAISGGAAVAALAYVVDYRLTPKRLTPGFEKRLSKRSLVMVYSAFALGLAAVHLAKRGGR